MARQVNTNYPEFFSQPFGESIPDPGCFQITMQKHYWLAFPGIIVKYFFAFRPINHTGRF
jgi:hypothetical protein